MQNILGKYAGISLGETASIVGICCLFLYFIKAGQTMSEWNKEKDGRGKYKAALFRSLSSTRIKNIVIFLKKRFVDTYWAEKKTIEEKEKRWLYTIIRDMYDYSSTEL